MRGSEWDAAVSELARRILRSNGVEVMHNGQLSEQIENLSKELSDKAPKIIFGIKSIVSESENIVFQNLNSSDGIISLNEPDSLDIVWVKGGIEVWNQLQSKIVELGRAGYPGCVGCAGPAASEPWDEVKSRSQKN